MPHRELVPLRLRVDPATVITEGLITIVVSYAQNRGQIFFCRDTHIDDLIDYTSG